MLVFQPSPMRETTKVAALSSIDMFAQKVRHFLILVPKTAMINWQKLSGKSKEPNAAIFVVIRIGL